MTEMKSLNHSIPILILVLFSATSAKMEVVYAQVGQSVTLKLPEGYDTNPSGYLYWFFSGNSDPLASHHPLSSWSYISEEKWKGRLSVSNSALTITKLQEDDFGTFKFSKFNTQSNGYQDIYTCDMVKITVTMTPLSPLLAGDPVLLSLTCNVEVRQNEKPPEIYWRNPQNKKMNSNKVSEKVTSQHNGQWTCVVKNNRKESTAIISVTVIDLSPASSPYQYTSKSSSLLIPCCIPSHVTWDQIKNKNINEVQWHFSPKLPSGNVSNDQKQKLFSLLLDTMQWRTENNKGLEPVPDVNKGNLSLTKRQGKKKESGDYECMMKFKNGVTLRRTVHVELLQISASPGTNLTSGQQLNLTCSVGSVLPSDMQLKWFPPDKLSDPSLKSDHLLLPNVTIPEVRTEHGGKWRCELWQGSTRLTSETIMLKIVYKLSVWVQVTIYSAAVIVIVVLILVFIIYRRRQRKLRHPRHQLCQCKHPKPKGFYKT